MVRAALWGGDVRSLAIQPLDPDVLAAGTSAGHVYLSRDGGRSWTAAGAPVPFAGWVVGTLRFDPSHPRRLWAALWGVWGSGMVAMSDDLGVTWRERRGVAPAELPGEPVYDLQTVPGSPDLLYAGTLSGVWVSRDAGLGWHPLTGAYPEIHHVSSLFVHPDRPGTLIAGTWRRAYRSDDGGRTWDGVFSGMELDSEVFQLRPVPGQVRELWASTCGWVYHTTDLGDHWTRFKDGLAERRTPAFAVLEDGRLLAGTFGGLYVSADRGRSWQRRTDPGLIVRAIAHDPRRPDRIVLATEGAGIWRSSDGGDSFQPSSRGMTNVRVGAIVGIDRSEGAEVLAAVVHAGPLSGIYRSTDGGRSFEAEALDLPLVLALADAGDRVYAGTEEGMFERSSSGWSKVMELGDQRIEQVVAEGERVVARTSAEVFERDPQTLRFRLIHSLLRTPRSVAVTAGAVWLSDDDGLYRWARESDEVLSAPLSGAHVEPMGEGALLWGRGEAWYRSGPGRLWKRVTDRKVVRVAPTGDRRHPVLIVGAETVTLLDSSAQPGPSLKLPVPAREVAAAALVEGRLLLGTTGQGLMSLELSSGG